MLHSSIKKIRVNLEYASNNASIDVEPYRPIKYLKERASQLFYPIKFEMILLHSNKDLTSYDNISLGEYFKNKSNLTIKITLNLNKNKNVESIPNNAQNEENYDCSCHKTKIKHFCRQCNEFVCETCRLNKTHRFHQAIHVDLNNLSESIKLYAISLQADISMNINNGKKYSEEYQYSKFIDFQSRKEIIVRKLDELERRQIEMLKNLPEIDHNIINNVIIDFEDKASRTNIEIEQLIDDLFSKKSKRVNLETAVSYFNMINRKEKDIEKLSGDVAAYRMEYEINKKFDNLYNAIEKAIDNVLKNEFNLGYNSNENSIVEVNKELKEDMENKFEINQVKKEQRHSERIAIEAKDKDVTDYLESKQSKVILEAKNVLINEGNLEAEIEDNKKVISAKVTNMEDVNEDNN